MDPIEGPLYVHLSINHTSTYVRSSNGRNIFLETDEHDGLSGKCPCFTTATNYITPRDVQLGHFCDTIISHPSKIPYDTWKYLRHSKLDSDIDFYGSISLSRLRNNVGPKAFLPFPSIENSSLWHSVDYFYKSESSCTIEPTSLMKFYKSSILGNSFKQRRLGFGWISQIN